MPMPKISVRVTLKVSGLIPTSWFSVITSASATSTAAAPMLAIMVASSAAWRSATRLRIGR